MLSHLSFVSATSARAFLWRMLNLFQRCVIRNCPNLYKLSRKAATLFEFCDIRRPLYILYIYIFPDYYIHILYIFSYIPRPLYYAGCRPDSRENIHGVYQGKFENLQGDFFSVC